MDRIEEFGGQTVRMSRDGQEWVSRIELSHFQSRRHANAEAAFSEARRHIKTLAADGTRTAAVSESREEAGGVIQAQTPAGSDQTDIIRC